MKCLYRRFFGILYSLLCALSAWGKPNDSIPFVYTGHICLPAVVNDSVHCQLIFDTGGATVFGVDSVFLAHSSWKPQRFKRAMAKGAAGSQQVRVVTEPTSVQLGTLRNNYTVVPIFALRDIVDCHVDGIIGIGGIDEEVFEINFEQSYMQRHEKLPQKVANYTRIPILYNNHQIWLKASTQIGQTTVSGWYLMDTGSGDAICFTLQTVKHYRLDSINRKRTIIDVRHLGLGDKQEECVIDMLSDQIIIGQDTIANRIVSYLPEAVGSLNSQEWLGIIGNGIWKEYNIILDIKHQTMYLQRFKRSDAIEGGYDYTFRNRTDICDGWIVSSLAREGEAVKAGMALGDTIVNVNGKGIKTMTWEEEILFNKNAVNSLVIKGVNGVIKRITLNAKQYE